MNHIVRKIAAYVLAIIGVPFAMIAVKVLSAGVLSIGIWLGCIAAAFWAAAFTIDPSRRTRA